MTASGWRSQLLRFAYAGYMWHVFAHSAAPLTVVVVFSNDSLFPALSGKGFTFAWFFNDTGPKLGLVNGPNIPGGFGSSISASPRAHPRPAQPLLAPAVEHYDYIVVGAGSAGCVVAARLTESGRHRVLLLEAGPSDRRLWTRVPIGYGRTFYDTRVNWAYRTEPVQGLDGRAVYQPRGKVLGGSSSINAMVYSRGQASDFDAWEAMGNPGWGWRDVLAVYKRMEDHFLGDGPWHGAGGPLHVTDIASAAHPLTGLFIEAGKQAGLSFNPDLNGETIEGVGYYQINTRGGFRESASRCYLGKARRRPNLRIATGALATRVLLDGKRAWGVAYSHNGLAVEARADAEVILSCGAINTPQLLQLSGIGPAEVLKAAGVEMAHHAPGVGRNFQDHLCYDHVYRSRRPSLNDELGPLRGKIRAGFAYLLARRGPLALSVNQGGAFLRTDRAMAHPNMQLYFSPLTYERTPPGTRALMRPDPYSGFCTSASPCRPASRGHVAIRSADPQAAPAIVPNYLSSEHDVAELLAGARMLRRLAATPAFAAIIAEELKPGGQAETDDELVADMRARSYSVFHPCGTCRMGPDPAQAVVDHRLKVYGLDGLRVVDASIFPAITSGNINAPAIMVGEMGAGLILRQGERG